MDNTSWLKQASKPLFPDLLWSRPQNKRTAGKLLIIGGNSHSFSSVSQAYLAAEKAGAGAVRATLPDSLQKSLGKVFPEAEFAPSTPSGSFARDALASCMDSASWADNVLLAGDFGKNSETAILLESFTDKYKGSLVIAGDGVDYFLSGHLLNRPKSILVVSFAQAQRLASAHGLALKHSMVLAQLVESLNGLTSTLEACLVTEHESQIVVSLTGQSSTTPSPHADLKELAAYCAVWQMWHPTEILKAASTAAYESVQT